MKEVYPERLAVAKRPTHDFAAELDSVIRRKVGELIQAALEAEVDEALQRLKYERASGGAGYRDGHDPERTIVTGAGSIPFRRPRVRGAEFSSDAGFTSSATCSTKCRTSTSPRCAALCAITTASHKPAGRACARPMSLSRSSRLCAYVRTLQSAFVPDDR